MTELLPDSEALESIVTDVFAGLLGVPDPPVALWSDDEPASDQVLARIDITGMWEGSVTVACTEQCARTVAGLLLAAAPDELSPDDVTDAAGELVNIVGGNVKALMPGPSALSLPSVSSAEDAPALPADLALPLQWRDQILTIRISTPNVPETDETERAAQ